MYEFVRKGDPPVMGITKLGNGLTEADVRRPRKKLPEPNLVSTAGRLGEHITSGAPFAGSNIAGLSS